MNESVYQALKMAEEYHSRKHASNPDQAYPKITEILVTAREIFEFINSLSDLDEEFPLDVDDVV